MAKRPYLFIGGPLHAQSLDVEEVAPVVIPGAQDVAPPDRESDDPDDAFPDVVVRLDHATHYTKRTVAHVSNEDSTTYRLRVYVWEGIADPQSAQLFLGDAVSHRYFVEHGTKIDAVEPAPARSRIIVPGS